MDVIVYIHNKSCAEKYFKFIVVYQMGHSQWAFFYSYPKSYNKILHLWQLTDKK